MNRTSAVAVSIHAVSPELIGAADSPVCLIVGKKLDPKLNASRAKNGNAHLPGEGSWLISTVVLEGVF